MNEVVKRELAGAVQDCIVGAKAGIAMFFALGRRVNAIASKCDHQPTDENGICVKDAIDIVKQHLVKESQKRGFALPAMSAYYWYGAAQAVRELNGKQLKALVDSGTAWSCIPPLLKMPNERRDAAVAGAGVGKPLRLRAGESKRERMMEMAEGEAVNLGIKAERPLDVEKVENLLMAVVSDIVNGRAELTIDEYKAIHATTLQRLCRHAD